MPTPYGDITTTQTWLTPAEEPAEEVVEDSTNEEEETDDL